MLVAEVQFFDVVVWLHVTAVVLAFGPTFAYGLFFATAAQTNPAALPTIGRVVLLWGRTATRYGVLLILATGIYLTIDRFDFGYFFITWGMVAALVLLALSEAYFNPSTKRFVEAAEAGRDDEAQAIAAQRVVGPLTGLIVIITLYVMVAKPFS